MSSLSSFIYPSEYNERKRAEQRTFKKIVYYMPLLLMDIFRTISLGENKNI